MNYSDNIKRFVQTIRKDLIRFGARNDTIFIANPPARQLSQKWHVFGHHGDKAHPDEKAFVQLTFSFIWLW